MTLSFDSEIDRRGTHCVKWEFEFENHQARSTKRTDPTLGRRRLLALWIADMDFHSPQPVIDALEARAGHGVFGYSMPNEGYYEAVQEWVARRYDRRIERDWIVLAPGVVTALYQIVRTFTAPGDKVLVQPPVYPPFYSCVEENGREIVRNPLKLAGAVYEMDFEDLERKTADPAVTMAILCSPHNPIGRVWTAAELARLGQICRDNGVLVVSDEIHADLIFDGHTFTSFACAGDGFEETSIVCTAPSKTFNLAGLKASNIIIPDAELRGRFAEAMGRSGIWGTNAFGIVATEAAYRYGEPWLEEVMAYIQDNYRFLASFMAENLPQITVMPLQGTYLAWVNFAALGLDPEARRRWLLDEVCIWLTAGSEFGAEGADYERINIACPRSILAEALDRLKAAVDALERSAAGPQLSLTSR